MRRKHATGRRTHRRCAAVLCSFLTAYGTSPYAQAPTGGVALRLSLRVSPEFAPPGAPLMLRLSLELSDPADFPPASAPPVALHLALLLREFDTGMRSAPQRATGDAAATPVFYAVRINRQDLGVARLLRLPDGRWYARREDLEAWRLRIPASSPLLFGGEEHYALDAFEGIAYRVDEPLQQLDIDVAPRYFAATVVDSAAPRAPRPAPPQLGGFVNYDLFIDAARGSRRLSGLFEGAVFNRYGVGLANFLAQDGDSQSHLVRLDTAWRRDFPERMRTLVIGDAIGANGVWGRAVRFGGVSYGTNFATNPNLITFPLPIVRGEATLPTTTELYVNGALRQSGNVPPGPFRIQNLPVITGQGEVRLVVRDLLGREQVITMPYYASSVLLRRGLTEESNELGAVRNNFGLRSNDYGRGFAALQRRRGFTDRITGEARMELLRDQQTVGGGTSVAFPALGVLTAAAAVSHGKSGVGELAFAGVERQVSRGVSLGARSQWTSRDFAQLGLPPDQRPPRRVMSVNAGFSPLGVDSFAVAYIRQDNRDAPSAEILSATYSVTIARSAALMVFGLKPLNGQGSSAVGVALSMGFGERGSASTSVTAQPHATEAIAQVQQNLPAGPGTGYRFLAGGGARGDREEVGFAWQTNSGTYVAEAGRADDTVAFRASASGAIALLDERVYLARTLNESFGVAHVPGFPGVGVYLNNQLVARTDASGYALLPGLLPYQANAVRIDESQLPLDTRIGAVSLDAVPYFRSGLVLTFPIEPANGALLSLVLDDGSPMPAGSTVGIVGKSGEFPVAERGEAYVTGLGETNTLRASWRGQSCEFKVDMKGRVGSLPRLGPIACRGVAR